MKMFFTIEIVLIWENISFMKLISMNSLGVIE